MLRFVLLVAGCVASISWAETEIVEVKYRGNIDLKPFSCTDITRSSFINRVCYDEANQYMLIQLKLTYSHYCELPTSTLNALLEAPSMGQFFNKNIKGTGAEVRYDCRTRRIPQYSVR